MDRVLNGDVQSQVLAPSVMFCMIICFVRVRPADAGAVSLPLPPFREPVNVEYQNVD